MYPSYNRNPYNGMVYNGGAYGSWGKPLDIVYSGTVTDLRISTSSNADPLVASGGAFVDSLPQAILDLIAANPAGTLQFDVYSSASLLLRGVLKALGSAEGLSGGLLDAWTNHTTVKFETFTVSGSDITQATNTGGGGALAYRTLSAPGYKLYKNVNTYTLNSGTAPLYGLVNTSNQIIASMTLGGTSYATAPSTAYSLNVMANSTAATDFALTSNSLKQVLAPSATGATIVSAKFGATYNWGVNQWVAGSYNAATNYVIVRRLR